ncbi:MAG TPA: toll/interleukin-1 receptor domain-containing protein [Bryobacteraceae bacterium]|nr:toll/interleukin-1 receptor domain-containing protein [Bryobacteraceae bacterium]
MPGVFISYRREDSSGYAGRLFDILSSHFGRQNTFMDLDTIQGGDDFPAVIEEKIRVSDVLVAVIGTKWVTVTEENGTRRLDNPHDFVRLEIGKALERGIRVIPLLVGGAAMPHAEDLPIEIRPLCEREAVEIGDAHFHSDTDQLVDLLHKTLHGVSIRSAIRGGPLVPLLLSGIAVVIIVAGILLFRQAHSVDRTSAAVHAADIAGNWNATVKYDWGDTYTEAFAFEVDGRDVSGTASFLGSARGILDGKTEDDRISFMTKSLATISSDEKTYEDKHYYKGTVQNGTIRFTMTTDSDMESHVPIHFMASKTKTH